MREARMRKAPTREASTGEGQIREVRMCEVRSPKNRVCEMPAQPQRDMPPRRLALFAALALAAGRGHAGESTTEPGPHASDAPLRIVVAYPNGGVTDTIARALAVELTQQTRRQVLVENRAGAGGAIALRALRHLPADGSTLVLSAITPLALDPELAADRRAGRGAVAVAEVMQTPFLLVGTSAFAGHDFADLLQIARARPDRLRWATSGIATTGHLVLEEISAATGIAVTHIPYNGGGQQLTDALGGQFELLSTNVGPLQLRYVQDGRFKALAVGAPARLALLADVPTLAELGLPRANLTSRFGLYAAAGTPDRVVQRLNAEIDRALLAPAIRDALLASANLPGRGSAADFARSMAREIARIRLLKGRRSRPG